TRVTQSVRPLRPLDLPASLPLPHPEPPASAPPSTAAADRPSAAPAGPMAGAAGAIEARLMRRLRRGGAAVDAVLDLHGLTQARAHSQLLSFLHGAQAAGHRVVLVVTGKGQRGESGD